MNLQSKRSAAVYSLFSALLLSVNFILPTSTFAADRDGTRSVELFTATSDAFSGSLTMGANVDDASDLVSFVYTAVGTTKTIQLSNLKAGIVLYQASGKDAAVLSSNNFNAQTGGSLTVKYLEDGVSGTYDTFECEMIRQGQTWKMTSADSGGDQKVFTLMYLTAKKLFGTVIGIASITVQ
jgi:hypothetical protein